MKPIAVLIFMLAAVCLLSAACSPREEKRGIRSSPAESTPPEQPPSSPPIDPWKAATEQPVPTGPVGDAQRFLLNASAYQFTTEWENLNTHQKAHEEGRVVQHEALWIESTGPRGKDGIITDGKREFIFFQGRYGQEPGDAAAALSEQLRGASLQSLLDQSEEHASFLDSEKLDGVEAELYALTARLEYTKRVLRPAWSSGGGHLRVWIAKNDHRPLKVEMKESYADQQKPGVTQVCIQVRMYYYDPNVKVTLPGS